MLEKTLLHTRQLWYSYSCLFVAQTVIRSCAKDKRNSWKHSRNVTNDTSLDESVTRSTADTLSSIVEHAKYGNAFNLCYNQNILSVKHFTSWYVQYYRIFRSLAICHRIAFWLMFITYQFGSNIFQNKWVSFIYSQVCACNTIVISIDETLYHLHMFIYICVCRDRSL